MEVTDLMAFDDIESEIRRQAKNSFIAPSRYRGLTEDEAVASVIEQYKAMAGIELP